MNNLMGKENDEAIDILANAYVMAKDDLIAFRQIFIPSEKEVRPAWYHHIWSKELLHGSGHFVCQAFRESSKSTIISRAFMLHSLVFPQKRFNYIVIIMATQDFATKRLKEISSEYLTNDVFKLNLIETISSNEKVFHAKVQDLDGKVKEVRIEAYGKGSSIRGLVHKGYRPSLLLIDDLNDMADMKSKTVLNDDWDWFLSDIIFLGKEVRIFMLGNNLGESCVIERVKINSKRLGFESMVIPILNEVGESNWPEYFPVEAVLKERENFTAMDKLSVWVRDKMCKPMADSDQLFKLDMFKYYKPEQIILKDLNIYVGVDLAISEKTTADYTVVATVGVNKENHWFILDVKYGRVNPSQNIDWIFEAVSKYRPNMVVVEKAAYQASLMHWIQKAMQDRNIFFHCEPIGTSQGKIPRINTLHPRFKQGLIWFPNMSDFNIEMEKQFIAFPRGEHDDIPDAISMLEPIAFPPVFGFDNDEEDDMPFAGAM